MKSPLITWLSNQFGNKESSLYLGGIYVGEIQHLSHSNQWRGWFMSTEDGSPTGYFDTASEARRSVESAVLGSLPSELAMLAD